MDANTEKMTVELSRDEAERVLRLVNAAIDAGEFYSHDVYLRDAFERQINKLQAE